MPTMPNTRASDASPAAIARAALRRLAEQGIEPTPEAYRRAYLEAAPPGSRPPGAPLLDSNCFVLHVRYADGTQWPPARN